MSVSAVHPRWRGEQYFKWVREAKAAGSSPLARGTATQVGAYPVLARFIPAGAGNRLTALAGRAHQPVHPRWRGEQRTMLGSSRACRGSSPLARGTVLVRDDCHALPRFIPAGAGNSRVPASPSGRTPVHPRWRGEQPANMIPGIGFTGSSPLARGTDRAFHSTGHGHRFIPAGAGNSSKLSIYHLLLPVHPRWRGEQICVS